MGYYTHYELKIENDNSEALIKELRSFSKGAEYALEENGDCSDSCKWYDHEDDMKAFSKLHPDVFFNLAGNGEEKDDTWMVTFVNGMMHKRHGVMIFPPFDPKELKK